MCTLVHICAQVCTVVHRCPHLCTSVHTCAHVCPSVRTYRTYVRNFIGGDLFQPRGRGPQFIEAVLFFARAVCAAKASTSSPPQTAMSHNTYTDGYEPQYTYVRTYVCGRWACSGALLHRSGCFWTGKSIARVAVFVAPKIFLEILIPSIHCIPLGKPIWFLNSNTWERREWVGYARGW